ncbi:hypothetical protein T492DRAFT_892084 [Pavlovales sp. CCMP2436]|nr:hypothetical protein T492DRAFT_892084 [Pavlovales sp. CCMP2436]
MASRRAIALAAGAATTAIAAAGSHDAAECNAVSPSMSMSFEVITAGEIEKPPVAKLPPPYLFATPMHPLPVNPLMQDVSRQLGATTRSVLALGKDLARDPRVQAAVLERIRGELSA